MKSKCFFCQGFPLKFYYIAIIITDMLGFRMEKYKNTRRIHSAIFPEAGLSPVPFSVSSCT